MTKEFAVQMLLPFMIPPELTYWTHDTVMCHKLTGDCSKCPMGRLSLDIDCRLSAITPVLVERIGEPVSVLVDNVPTVMGAKQLTKRMQSCQQIWDHVADNPGVTAPEIQALYGFGKDKVIKCLNKGFALGFLTKERATGEDYRCMKWFRLSEVE